MTSGLLVPLYADPSGGLWKMLSTAARKHPTVPIIAVINPADGPGAASRPGYVSGIIDLRSAAIKILGYVDTIWGGKPQTTCANQALRYWNWYRVDGVFWDETSAGGSPFFDSLTAYIRGLGMTLSVANVGSPGVVPGMDITLEYEDVGVPSRGFNYLAYGVRALPASFPRSDWIYITDDSGGNPWDTLPTYLDALLSAMSGGPVPIPDLPLVVNIPPGAHTITIS